MYIYIYYGSKTGLSLFDGSPKISPPPRQSPRWLNPWAQTVVQTICTSFIFCKCALKNSPKYQPFCSSFFAKFTVPTNLNMFGTIKFCEENDYIIGDKRYLPENSFTFYSDTHDSVPWLDHAICSAAMFNTISSIDVLYNFLTSDHFVLSIKLDKVYAKQLCNLCDEGFNITRIKWDQLSHDIVSKYTVYICFRSQWNR